MKRYDEKPGAILDRALSEIQAAPIDLERKKEAAAKVLARIHEEFRKVVPHPASIATAEGAARIRNCAGFQSLIPAYLSSSLTSSRKLLLEDHAQECVACRKAITAAKDERQGISEPTHSFGKPAAQHNLRQIAVWTAASAILLAAGLAGIGPIRGLILPIEVYAVAQTVDGSLFRVSNQDVRSIQAGERIERSEIVRTGSDAGAVLELADGSQIEMSARSELQLDRAADGVRIELSRGSVIVAAAKQRRGHLYVATKDCVASVVGTVFSVDAGDKGSRVSVISGEVHVDRGTSSQSLLPGQQLSTGSTMTPVPVREEIAWSRNRDAHLAALPGLKEFGEHLAKGIAESELPHESKLAALTPEDTAVFVSLPNLSQSLSESYALLQQRIAENPAMQQKWLQLAAGPGKLSLDELVRTLAAAESYLGSEIVITVPKNGRSESPVVLAATERPRDLAAAIENGIAGIAKEHSLPPVVRVVQSEAELDRQQSAKAAGVFIFIDRGLMIASADSREIKKILAIQQQTQQNPFVSTSLYGRIRDAYASGVSWFVAADAAPFNLGDIRQFVLEQAKSTDGVSYRAALGFDGQRHGVASWLGDPAPMGALQFVSPNAYGAAGLITKDPAAIVKDVLPMLHGADDEVHPDLQNDLAASLGNEFLIALDGPILPSPSWKAIIEVNDAVRLENTIQSAVTEINRRNATRQEPPIALTSATADGRTFYGLSSKGWPVSIQYVFWAGYMIVAPNRTLLTEAIQDRETENTLDRSAQFRALFPADGHDYTSGFIYQNLHSIAGKAPTLVCLYGERDQIVLSSKGVLGTNFASMIGFRGMLRTIGMAGMAGVE